MPLPPNRAATKPSSVVLHEGQEVGALFRRELDPAHAEEEDGVEVVEIADIELLARRDAGPSRKRDGVLGDELRVRADERVVASGLASKALDRRDGVGNGIVLIAVANVRPREHAFSHLGMRTGREGDREPRGDDQCASHGRRPPPARGNANATIFEPPAAPR